MSKASILASGRETFNLRFSDNFSQEELGYKIASEGKITLWFAVLSGSKELQNGTIIGTGNGFLITEEMEGSDGWGNSPWVVGLAFYPWTGGDFSNATDEYKQQVVDDYNSFLESGTVIETTETNIVVSLNSRGETYAEQSAREEVESRTGIDGVVYETTQMKDMMDRRWNLATLSETKIIREQTISHPQIEGGSMAKSFLMKITEITSGTNANPEVSYRVEARGLDAADFIDSFYDETFETQLEAETAYDNYLVTEQEEFLALQEAEVIHLRSIATTTTNYTKYDVFFQESPLTFEQMLVGGGGFEYNETAFRVAHSIEADGARSSGLYTGYWQDAAYWSGGGNTLELDDFDAPRVTTSGVSENPSGAVAFTVKKGWKVSFTLKIDDGAAFINDAVNDDITVDGNEFDFTMYGGDRLEIDIDNEREGIHPFLISTQGKKWSSVEEVDDEISITMNSAEKLFYSAVIGTQETFIESGEVKEITVDKELEGPVSFTSGPLSESSNLIINSEINAIVNSNQEYKESLIYTRNLQISDVAAESSFVTTDELLDPVTGALGDAADSIGDAAGDIASGIWDSVKWWLLGGVIVIGLVIVGASYMKGRGARPAAVVSE